MNRFETWRPGTLLLSPLELGAAFNPYTRKQPVIPGGRKERGIYLCDLVFDTSKIIERAMGHDKNTY